MNARAKIGLLTFFFAMCGTGAIITAWLQERADANVKPTVLYAVVEHQLGQLRGGNFSSAYQDASFEIQRRFTVEQFATMVQEQYPGMMHISRAQYGAVETRGSHATIEVYLIGQNGEVMPCIYMMVREGDAWRIDGARLLEQWPEGMREEGQEL
jgi:hypothetical protein